MRKIFIFFILSSVVLFNFTACEDMLDVDSDRYVDVDDNDLSSPNDSVYSMLGLFTQLQNIGVRHILFGEMRGDLLDVNVFTSAEMRQISNFAVDPTSEYADPTDFYDIINNCNYFISRTSDENNPLKRENAAAHAIRAWTYMQIAFNWGKVYYYTDPILKPEDAGKDYPVYDFTKQKDEFLSLLIEDLTPFVDVPLPSYGTIYDFDGRYMFFPVRVLLGDLYLWRGQGEDDYEKSATYYAEYIANEWKNTGRFATPYLQWSYDAFLRQDFENYGYMDAWSSYTIAGSGHAELITAIQMATKESEGLTSSIKNRYLHFQPSNYILSLWDDQSNAYYYKPTKLTYYTTGDLRKQGNILASFRVISDIQTEPVTVPVSYKIYRAEHIMLYRMGLIWLRYAEALNRSGRPNAAFAVLKYGLNRRTIDDRTKIPESESASFISILNELPTGETDTQANHDGIHARGCGHSEFDIFYTIDSDEEELTTKTDSIRRVEDLICDELAMETSFEGNRFPDLIRFSLRRENPDFLASRVAAKHESDPNRIYQLLLDMNNWFLPEPLR